MATFLAAKQMEESMDIEKAKAKTRYSENPPYHEHQDCIAIAIEWLSAQKRTKRPGKRTAPPLKHIIESWAGRYVSQSDVEVAATVLNIPGRYPHYAISQKMIKPSLSRLDGIGEAMTQLNYCNTNYRYQADEDHLEARK